MLLTISELSQTKKIYVSYESLTLDKFTYAVYTVSNYEYRGFNKHYVKIKTSSQNKLFRKEINMVGYAIDFKYSTNPYQFSDNLEDLKKSFCKKLKKNPEKNEKLLKELTEQYPHYFI